MECPTCKCEMTLLKRDTSRSKLQEKSYDRTIYGCQEDDAWVTIEVPQQETTSMETETLPMVSA